MIKGTATQNGHARGQGLKAYAPVLRHFSSEVEKKNPNVIAADPLIAK